MNKPLIIVLVLVLAIFLVWAFMGTEEVEYTQEEAEVIASEWVRENSPTYLERGGEDLTLQSAEELDRNVYEFVFAFEAMFAGYGPVEEDEMAAQVITDHLIRVVVENGQVVEAITNEEYDEMNLELVDEVPVDEEEEEIATVNLYFVQIVDEMEEIVSVEREIELLNGMEYSALVALLEGPTQEEMDEGYSTSIPEGADLLSLEIEEGLAVADFSSEIDPGGGSAWVMSIRDQVSNTLLQFETVDQVEILVEGEEGLQP